MLYEVITVRISFCNDSQATLHLQRIISITRGNNRSILMHFQQLLQTLTDSQSQVLLLAAVQPQRSGVFAPMTGVDCDHPLTAIGNRLFLAKQEGK